MPGTLYLFPVNLAESPLDRVLPAYNFGQINAIRSFIVEDVRTARRFLKQINKDFDIDACVFYELNQHTTPESISGYLTDLERGIDMGLLSEAGCPAIADPGAEIVEIAQTKGFRVAPLVGPSSILLALMGSGFNGQRFAFEGYLPVEKDERIKTIKRLEARSYSEDMTQLFIETPYRNGKMMEDLVHALKPHTKICVALDLTGPEESIRTLKASEWKKQMPQLPKKPCIFGIYKG
jgi:16S rRNA (cytidine1402-2'-O)-methyltransferase